MKKVKDWSESDVEFTGNYSYQKMLILFYGVPLCNC